jgi:hypothetical protein
MGIAADAASVGVAGPPVVAALGDGAPALGSAAAERRLPAIRKLPRRGAGLAGVPARGDQRDDDYRRCDPPDRAVRDHYLGRSRPIDAHRLSTFATTCHVSGLPTPTDGYEPANRQTVTPSAS